MIRSRSNIIPVPAAISSLADSATSFAILFSVAPGRKYKSSADGQLSASLGELFPTGPHFCYPIFGTYQHSASQINLLRCNIFMNCSSHSSRPCDHFPEHVLNLLSHTSFVKICEKQALVRKDRFQLILKSLRLSNNNIL